MKWIAWKCPWCGWSNNRDHEGLDECDKCHSEAATAYTEDGEALYVKWAREPRKAEPLDIQERPSGRDAVIEECAKVCDETAQLQSEMAARDGEEESMVTYRKARAWDASVCAAKIRALKATPPDSGRDGG